MEETNQTKPNYKMLSPNGRALLGLKEVIKWRWFDVEALCRLSMLSTGARRLARKGKYWRWALRNMFPQHPFQASDREFELPNLHGVRYMSSRSAKTDNDQTADQNNFRVCLDLIHAKELLKFALGEPNKISWKSTVSCQIVPNFEPIFREWERIELEHAYKPNVVDCTVIVDLCRPHQFSLHTISIYNDKSRSHSNLPDETNPEISHLVDPSELRRKNTPSWRPRAPSDPNEDEADFVVIRCGDESKWYLEGVAVHASRPVAIRVDVKTSNGRYYGLNWVEVAGGAVLRPHRRADVVLKVFGKTQTVQIIALPKPYPGCRLHSVRVEVVECDGSPVQLGLLVSQSLNKSGKVAHRDSLYTNRSENFESVDAYRDWWYRLQLIRRRVSRVLPVLVESSGEVNTALSHAQDAYAFADREDLRDSCVSDVRVLLLISFIVYVVLLFVAFPIMLALNLDQLERVLAALATGKASNTTTTSSYNMASPDPDRLVRTVCWQPDSHKALPPLVSWVAVFSPCALAIVYALAMISLRAFERSRVRRKVMEAYDQFTVADQALVSVHKQAKARAKAAVTGEGRAGPVAVVKELADKFAVSDELMADRCHISPDFKKVYLDKHFTLVNLIDASMLVISSFGILAYAVADCWCRHDDMTVRQSATENAVALPAIAAVLCIVLDAFVGALLGALTKEELSDFPYITQFSFAIFVSMLVQQVLLLLELFTLFRKVSFFFVFFPLIIIIISIIVCTFLSNIPVGVAVTFVGVPLVISVVLMMLKTDYLFGISNPGLPYFSWVLVMAPTWIIGGFGVVVLMLYLLFRVLCNW